MAYGKLYGIGVGPGDPELLTIKARRVLEEVDCLFVPKSDPQKRSLALSIVSQQVNKEWQIIEMLLPMIKDREKLSQYWQEAAIQAVQVLAKGSSGAFITLGDPGLYSTFSYFMKHLRLIAPQIEIEIIPGVSAINLVAGRLQQALVEGEESLLIAPAFMVQESLPDYLERFQNILLLKAGRQVKSVADMLSHTPVAIDAYIASRCGFDDEFWSDDLKSGADREWDYLTSILIKRKPGEGSR